MMKVVVIGGGVAGLTLGCLLNKANVEVVIFEKQLEPTSRGHAFLMHIDGWSILEELTPCPQTMPLPGEEIAAFCLKNQDGKALKKQKLNLWRCIKRKDLMAFFYKIFPSQQIKWGRSFSHFIYENGKVIAAQFTNGEIEYGDVFVGADGSNSAVREAIFGKVNFTPVEVKEVVGICRNDALATSHQNMFTKYQSDVKGLSFGMIPVSGNEFVWFMQYNCKENDCNNCTPEELKAFCNYMLADFPPVVSTLLESNDFSTSYIWNTRDFGVLPRFHQNNVVLMGDAAHLALPFTSAGTTNAILDAKLLSRKLLQIDDLGVVFEQFYTRRVDAISKHVALGRELKEAFLNPQRKTIGDKLVVPLISKKEKGLQGNKPIQVQYFTDPICSTCWVVQPMLRKLKLEYGQYFDIDYRMGGLLPSWDDYQRGPISKPTDVAPHWEEVCMIHGIPLDGDIWLEDPLPSSYPPSIAFKAAQMQDGDLAVVFLRRIKEMVFLEKKNIVDMEYLEKAAFEVGLDSAKFVRDYEEKANEEFRKDLQLAQKMQVGVFPTLIFTNQANQKFESKGYQEYEYLENIILQLVPNAEKKPINTDPIFLFSNFSTMTNKEFSFLSDTTIEQSDAVLEELYQKGYIDKYESKNGIIWKSRLANY